MDRATCAYYSATAYAHAGRDEYIGSDPGFVFDVDGPSTDIEARGLHIVRSSADI